MKEKDIYKYIAEHCPYCMICGKTWRLHIHHIIYRSELGPTSFDNLIRLCEKCHEMVHSNKRVWQSRLQNILLNIVPYECCYDTEIVNLIKNSPLLNRKK